MCGISEAHTSNTDGGVIGTASTHRWSMMKQDRTFDALNNE
jgi:hypothetical protein